MLIYPNNSIVTFILFYTKEWNNKNQASSLKSKPKISILLEDGNKEYGPLS